MHALRGQKKKILKEGVAFWRFLEILFWGFILKFHENNTENDSKHGDHPTLDFSRSAPEVQVSDLAVF